LARPLIGGFQGLKNAKLGGDRILSSTDDFCHQPMTNDPHRVHVTNPQLIQITGKRQKTSNRRLDLPIR
jgi:hypothetical protein